MEDTKTQQVQVGNEAIAKVKTALEAYEKKFGELAENEYPQILKRLQARKKVELLDKCVDSANLSDEEILAWEVRNDYEHDQRSRKLFESLIEGNDLRTAEYLINNMKKVWSLEYRKELVKKLGDAYDINPETDLVDTKHNIKKMLKKKKWE